MVARASRGVVDAVVAGAVPSTTSSELDDILLAVIASAAESPRGLGPPRVIGAIVHPFEDASRTRAGRPAARPAEARARVTPFPGDAPLWIEACEASTSSSDLPVVTVARWRGADLLPDPPRPGPRPRTRRGPPPPLPHPEPAQPPPRAPRIKRKKRPADAHPLGRPSLALPARGAVARVGGARDGPRGSPRVPTRPTPRRASPSWRATRAAKTAADALDRGHPRLSPPRVVLTRDDDDRDGLEDAIENLLLRRWFERRFEPRRWFPVEMRVRRVRVGSRGSFAASLDRRRRQPRDVPVRRTDGRRFEPRRGRVRAGQTARRPRARTPRRAVAPDPSRGRRASRYGWRAPSPEPASAKLRPLGRPTHSTLFGDRAFREQLGFERHGGAALGVKLHRPSRGRSAALRSRSCDGFGRGGGATSTRRAGTYRRARARRSRALGGRASQPRPPPRTSPRSSPLTSHVARLLQSPRHRANRVRGGAVSPRRVWRGGAVRRSVPNAAEIEIGTRREHIPFGNLSRLEASVFGILALAPSRFSSPRRRRFTSRTAPCTRGDRVRRRAAMVAPSAATQRFPPRERSSRESRARTRSRRA